MQGTQVKVIVGILLFLFLLEASMIPIFTIPVPGSPLSLGRLALVGLGIIGWIHRPVSNRLTSHDWFLIILFIGTFIGTLFSRDFVEDIVTFIGFSLLLFSSRFSMSILSLKISNNIVNLFFAFTFVFWVYYVWSKVLDGGGFTTYGEIYRAEKARGGKLVNYHAFGLILSTAVAYFSSYFGWLKRVSLVGIATIIIGLATIFVTESRSNLLITIVVLIYLYVRQNKVNVASTIRLALIFIVVISVFSFFMGTNDRLNRRFDVNNTEYIEGSTSSRVAFIGLVTQELIKYPFGGGPNKNRVNYYGVYYQPHNQYLTFILFAGVFGIIATLIWLKTVWKLSFSNSIIKNRTKQSYLSIIHIAIIVLLTTDLSGSFFFFLLILQGWLIQPDYNN